MAPNRARDREYLKQQVPPAEPAESESVVHGFAHRA